MQRKLTAVLATAVAVSVALSLAGCIDNTPTPRPTKHHTSSATPSASPTPSATPTATNDSPVTQTCAQIYTAQQVYDYNPNVVADSSYTPKSGSFAAHAAAENGRACGWINETSNVQLDVAVSKPDASELAAAKGDAAANGGLAAFGANSTDNFQVAGGVGTLQVFSGDYWIIISSGDFLSASDAQPTATTILGNLGAG